MAVDPSPLVVTLKLDTASFDQFNALRQQHFPPERNFLPAHVTLFHALPRQQETAIRNTLQTLCAQTPRVPLHFPTLRFLGRGVAIHIESPALIQVQQQLATHWQPWLTAQDRQPYHPHITLQNKVLPDSARQLYNDLTQTWQPQEGYGEGLLLWYYQGGPWQLAKDYGFAIAPCP